MSRYQVVLIACVAALAGCSTVPPVVVPQVVHDVVKVYVPVPPQLTIACPVAEPADRTIGTLVGVAYARKQALQQCNDQLDKIRGLGIKH